MIYGKFVTKKTTRPATVVDCSQWADPATDQTYGKFLAEKTTRPAIPSRLFDEDGNPAGEMPPDVS